jgi:hypothetical protein
MQIVNKGAPIMRARNTRVHVAANKWMKLRIFRSARGEHVFGFTVDPTGCNLSEGYGPWLNAGGSTPAQSYAEGGLDGVAPFDPLIKAIERDGFYLARSGSACTSGRPCDGRGTCTGLRRCGDKGECKGRTRPVKRSLHCNGFQSAIH